MDAKRLEEISELPHRRDVAQADDRHENYEVGRLMALAIRELLVEIAGNDRKLESTKQLFLEHRDHACKLQAECVRLEGERNVAQAEAAKWKSAAEYAARREQDLEEAHDYAQKVYENFLEDLFPGEENKTWARGCTSRKIVEMIRTKIEGMNLQVGEVTKQREAMRLEVQVYQFKTEALLKALDQLHPRIGRPRHCGKDGCSICAVMGDYPLKRVDQIVVSGPCPMCGADQSGKGHACRSLNS